VRCFEVTNVCVYHIRLVLSQKYWFVIITVSLITWREIKSTRIKRDIITV